MCPFRVRKQEYISPLSVPSQILSIEYRRPCVAVPEVGPYSLQILGLLCRAQHIQPPPSELFA